MRISLLNSLVFAVLACGSFLATAAPTGVSSTVGSPSVQNVVHTTPRITIDLNVADVATLQRELAGVGEAKAKAIVAYRETNGPFSSVDELLEVKGIGKAILDRNRENVEVN